MSSKTDPEKEIDLGVIILPLFTHWKVVLGITLIFGVLAAAYSLTIPRYYQARAVIMSGGTGAGSSILSQLGGSGALSGILSMGGQDQALEKYRSILKSFSFVRKMLADHDLEKRFRDPNAAVDPSMPMEEWRARLVRSIVGGTIIESTGPVLTITYQHSDPQLAHDLVAAYLTALREFINKNVLSQAKNTEVFIRQRLEEAELKLVETEEKYVKAQRATGIFQLPIQSGQALGVASNLEAQLIEKDMEIALLRDLMKDSSEIKRLESERAQLQSQLNRVIEGKNSKSKTNEFLTPLNKIPELEMEFASLRRNYLILGRLVELLQKQLELAQIETKKSDPIFQVIDEPVVPIIPAGPSRRMITLIGMISGFLVSVVCIVVFSNLPSRATEKLSRFSEPLIQVVRRRKDTKRNLA